MVFFTLFHLWFATFVENLEKKIIEHWVAIIDSGLKWEQEWLLKNSPVLLQPSNMEKALKWSYSSEKLNADVDVKVTIIISFYF